jgi:hypothetical protein
MEGHWRAGTAVIMKSDHGTYWIDAASNNVRF